MNLILVLAFLFFVGSIIGWVLELFWRRFYPDKNSPRKWVNPGFLVGPYLPLYGFSLCILFLLSYIDVSFIENEYAQKAILFILMAFCITVIEYIAGLIFIKGMNIKLWDYTNHWGNINGIICPLYSFFWFALSGIYYFLIHPRILNWLYWFTNHLTFSFIIGFFYGIFVIDLFWSLNILAKVRKFAAENKLIVRIEAFKQDLKRMNEEFKEKDHFLFAFKSEKFSLSESLAEILKRYSERKERTHESRNPFVRLERKAKNSKKTNDLDETEE